MTTHGCARPTLMVRLGHNLILPVLLLMSPLAFQSSVAQTPSSNTAAATTNQAPKAHSRHKKTVAEQPMVPQTPPPPPTLEQTPPSAPHITYSGGQLTIDAQNSTLAQVLRSVQSQTGAVIEMPSSASADRVVTRLGPGPPRDVLNALLNGSKFDYIILGVDGDPGGVQRVILTPRQAATTATTAQNNPGQTPAQTQPGEEPQEEEMVGPGAEVGEAQPEEPQQMQIPGRFRPMPPNMAEQQGQDNENNGAPNSARSPEQLLQELQRMQQQQQQMQQQLNPANQFPQQQDQQQ